MELKITEDDAKVADVLVKPFVKLYRNDVFSRGRESDLSSKE